MDCFIPTKTLFNLPLSHHSSFQIIPIHQYKISTSFFLLLFIFSNSTNIGITLCHIPHPPIRRIPRHILCNPQIPHIQITNVEHGNLKIHIHRPDLPPRLRRRGLIERDLNLERLLRPTWKFLNAPNDLSFAPDVFR